MMEPMQFSWLSALRLAAVALGLVPVAVYIFLAATARRRRAAAVARLEAAQLSVQTATAQREAVKAHHQQLVAHAQWWHLLVLILPMLAAVGALSRLGVLATGVVLVLAACSYPLTRILWRNARLYAERSALNWYIYTLERDAAANPEPPYLV